ncbi:DUF6691 family protein [Sphingomicrobium flavum]|uniref:DUF6691 family protein n=1 Tax=Sphingomicrobium flavum TaxID=1229164 RepID=UPI0021AD885D|nr:DUF6691 family protein [Sphingomicrobium flavum]
MIRYLVPALSGLLFGSGLAISGMMDPARVRGFLDIFGAWDPTLAFVMGGATLVMAIGWAIQRRIAAPLAGGRFHLPGTQTLDRKLIAGAILFGAGWGLGGLCPGPAIASLAVNFSVVIWFVIAMLGGMLIHRLTAK